jgi:hypothetical protein
MIWAQLSLPPVRLIVPAHAVIKAHRKTLGLIQASVQI